MTSLPTRPLGRTGMEITRVGFGAWAIGGGGWVAGWGPQDDDESVAAIRHAVESGINWVDTAAIYGLGHSEEVVARALSVFADADRPYVFTKCGVLPDPSDPMLPNLWVGDPASIRREVEGSLARLSVERIDLYQMHWPPRDATPVELYWQTLLDLRAEGLVASVGMSNHSLDLLERAEAIGHVESMQPPFSLINRVAGGDVVPWCASHDTGVVVYSPMQSGLLTGSFGVERVAAMPADDWRSRNAEFQPPKLAANIALADALRPVAERHGTTVGSVAIAWTLAFDGVTGAIVGARRPDQIDGWIGAATLELGSQDLAEIAAAIGRTGAGAGPLGPPRAL
ncbi:MAG TPA: aldo/keto reductase [Acidimicrobiales bacterium]|nr:aldo/keto reductase [Acidimicrobiales bacterium]